MSIIKNNGNTEAMIFFDSASRSGRYSSDELNRLDSEIYTYTEEFKEPLFTEDSECFKETNFEDDKKMPDWCFRLEEKDLPDDVLVSKDSLPAKVGERLVRDIRGYFLFLGGSRHLDIFHNKEFVAYLPIDSTNHKSKYFKLQIDCLGVTVALADCNCGMIDFIRLDFPEELKSEELRYDLIHIRWDAYDDILIKIKSFIDFIRRMLQI